MMSGGDIHARGRPPRILFVAMQGSPHTARWIEMIADKGWDLHLFPIDGSPPNESLCGVTFHRPQFASAGSGDASDAAPPSFTRARAPGLKTRPFVINLREAGGLEGLRKGRVPLGESGETAPVMQGPGVLAALIRRLRPDVIHSLEFQHSGYLVLKAKEQVVEPFPLWIATNWGSDIFYFGRQAGHRAEISRLLQQIDFYSCECHRDIILARDFGYNGPVLPVLPNTGGFDLVHLDSLRSGVSPSRRRRIMIKGYQHFAGRALTSLAAIETLFERLRDYEIVLYSVSQEPLYRAQQLVSEGKLNIKIVGWASHDEMLRFFDTSRVYVGTSISDAISTSVLEAMAMGAFPIQTNTSCCDEWFEDGVSGFLTTPNDIDLIRARIQTALDEDELVDEAARINLRTVRARLDRNVLAPRVADFYEPVRKRLNEGVDLPRSLRTVPSDRQAYSTS